MLKIIYIIYIYIYIIYIYYWLYIFIDSKFLLYIECKLLYMFWQ